MPDDDLVAIPNGTRLYRRIDPKKTIYDSNRKERRPTSQNFQNSNDGTPMSVFAENVAQAHGESPQDFLRGVWSDWLLVAVLAEDMRAHKQKVYLDPNNQDSTDFHPSHAAVDGDKNDKTRKKLAEKFEWIKSPPNLHEPPDIGR
jgi:hypothetical protein